MEKSIEVATNRVKVISETKKFDSPESPKYYSRDDDGRFFPEGLILFAIIPYNEKANSFSLVKVTRNRQEFNDFVPVKDCRGESWLNKTCSLRQIAFEIMTNSITNEFHNEITKEEFETKRLELLNNFMNKD